MAHTNQDTLIWQWNCRGFHQKQAVLNQYLRQHTRRPDALLLQETNNAPTTLPGYQTFHTTHPLRRVSTLVRRRIPVIQHDLHSPHIEHLFLELIPNRKRKECIFLLNIYNSPKGKARCRFLTLFKKALQVAGRHPLLIGGDFNLAHTGWGYVRTEAAARNLWQDYHDLGLTLITDPSLPTRLGTSTARDSTPDLTFIHHINNALWTNTQQDLGSDHHILTISLPQLSAAPPPTKEFTDRKSVV